MIKDVARSLAAAIPDCTAEEIADILWLAGALPAVPDRARASPDTGTFRAPAPVSDMSPLETERPQADQPAMMLTQVGGPVSGGRMVPATAVGLRAPVAMSRPLSTARVFSLFKRIHRPGPPEVDIDATVEATADARRLTVVTRPGRERGLDVALVADTSPVMTAFGAALTEFEALLLRAGAFRTVSRWTLVPEPEVLIRDCTGVEHHPDRLIDPSGRRLVLMVTDAAADHWYRAAIWQTLRHWADVMPAALVHVLPEQYRAQGPLGSSAIVMRSRRPGGPNRAADIEVAWWDPDDTANGAVPIPVVGLRPPELAAWAQAVATGTGWVDAVWTHQPAGRNARETNADLNAEDRVRAFQITASRGAQALARILAGAPVLSWPLIRVLQARLVPGTGASELAEVLVGGLLERVTSTVGNEDSQFRFRPSVSELLSRGTTATEEWDTFEAISDYLERNAGTGNAIHALLADPQGTAWGDAELEPFAALGRSVAARLGLAPVGGVDAGTGEPRRARSIETHTGYEHVMESLPIRLPPRPVFLAGREGLLAELHTRLTGDDDSGPRIVALCGLGGTGKTSVALEYAHRHLGEIGLAWQFPAEDPAVLAAEYGRLAAQLGVMDMPQQQDPVTAVYAALRAQRVEWLLIFDDAPDPESVKAFLPPAGPGRVLITSQNPNWPGEVLEVPVFAPDVAAGFLVSRTRDTDRQAAAELAGELGGLPLALEQAAAYMTAAGETIAGYLALFRQRQEEMLALGVPIGYSKTVATTWTLAFRQLEKSRGAVGLLRLLAFCAPEAIPLRLMLQSSGGLIKQLGPDVAPVLAPLLEDPLAASEAVAALRRYSLITLAADGSVSVHALVQAVTLDQMPPGLADKWRQAAAALIEAAIPADTKSPDTWPVCATLLPHAQRVLAVHSVGMARIASYLGHSGSYTAARDLQRRIAEARDRVFGPEHPDTLAARASLADWTGEAGDPGGAKDQFTALLPIRERILDPEDRDTLITRASLAGWTGQAGDPALARDQFTDLLPVIEQVFGPEHPETLTARASLARWTGQAGDAAGARDQFTDLLPVIEHLLGPGHSEALTARHNLAHWTGQAGDAAGARDQFTDLLPVIEQVFGPGHPVALRARVGLAWWTGEAGDPAAARDQFAALLPSIEQVFGREHPETLAARASLARWYRRVTDVN